VADPIAAGACCAIAGGAVMATGAANSTRRFKASNMIISFPTTLNISARLRWDALAGLAPLRSCDGLRRFGQGPYRASTLHFERR
jgi:hypothetical protein